MRARKPLLTIWADLLFTKSDNNENFTSIHIRFHIELRKKRRFEKNNLNKPGNTRFNYILLPTSDVWQIDIGGLSFY